ncbi:MAG: hypothetical protein ACC707_00580 [Thiohalomonadales bacterium]
MRGKNGIEKSLHERVRQGVVVVLLLSAFGTTWAVSEKNGQRIDIGLSIFPRVLAVDNDFRHKLTAQGQVKIAFVYSTDQKGAEKLARLILRQRSTIANVSVDAVAISIDALLRKKDQEFSALFIAEKLSNVEIAELVELGSSNSRIIFSPFFGDVERGVTIGIMITSRVWPYLNMQTIADSHIKLNELLIKYAKHYK